MCVVSMVSDHYIDKWRERDWWQDDWPPATWPYDTPVKPYNPKPWVMPMVPYKTWPDVNPIPPYNPTPWVTPMVPFDPDKVSREEFDRVKQELEDLKKLLKRAKKYDKDNNEPDCEIDEKVETLKKIAKAFGVDIEIK